MNHVSLQHPAGQPAWVTRASTSVDRVVRRTPASVQRACACGGPGGGGSCPECDAGSEDALRPQPKPLVGATDDPLERDADRAADAVLRRAEEGPSATSVAHAPDTLAGHAAPATVLDTISTPGRPLDTATRTSMEDRFGRDFSGVRVHADADAARSAADVAARAYTVGPHVVFGAGQFAPSTTDGRHLLAHELAHVVQQEMGS